MGIGGLICTALYTAYASIKVLVEAVLPQCFLVVKRLMVVVVNIVHMIAEVLMDISKLLVNIFAQMQKMLFDFVNSLLGNPFEKLCKAMWKCDALLLELLDGNSLLTRLLFKAAEKVTGNNYSCSKDRYTQVINNIKDIVSSYDLFASTVCNFGITTSFGLEQFKKLINDFNAQVTKIRDICINAIKKAIKTVEEMENSIRKFGIYDFLHDLSSFVNCIFDDDICSEFSTINNQISNICSEFNLKQNTATGQFEFDKSFLDTIYENYDRTDDFCRSMEGMIDGLQQPGNSINNLLDGMNYHKAFDMTKFFVNIKRGNYAESLQVIFSEKFSIDAFKEIWNNNNILVDNNLDAMGITDLKIGKYDIRYFVPYQFLKKTSTKVEVCFGYEDITPLLPPNFPRTYNETDYNFRVPCPDNETVLNIFENVKRKAESKDYGEGNEFVRLIGPIYDEYTENPIQPYTKFYNYSQWCNLSNRINFTDEYDDEGKQKPISEWRNGNKDIEGNDRYIKVATNCGGGILLFINCFLDNLYGAENETSEDLNNQTVTEPMSGINETTVDVVNGLDRDTMNDTVQIGDYYTNVGALSIAMRDFMEGIDRNGLVEKFGEENIENSINIAKSIDNILNYNINDLMLRYT